MKRASSIWLLGSSALLAATSASGVIQAKNGADDQTALYVRPKGIGAAVVPGLGSAKLAPASGAFRITATPAPLRSKSAQRSAETSKPTPNPEATAYGEESDLHRWRDLVHGGRTPEAPATPSVVATAQPGANPVDVGADGDTTPADAARPTLTPQEQAQARAALQAAQARMSRARTMYKLQAITAAEAQLREAQAKLALLMGANNASIAAAEAALRDAETALKNLPPAKVQPADVAVAQAALQQAQAHLQALQAPPDPARVAAAQKQLATAQQNHDKVAAAGAAATVAAQQNVLKATDALQSAQQAYDKAVEQNQQAQNSIDPQTGKSFADETQAAAAASAQPGATPEPVDPAALQKQIDAAKQQYAELLANAATALKDTQTQLSQAKTALENAQQQESKDVAATQALVDQAKAELDALLKAPSPDDVARAKAQVDQAQAQLDKLQKELADANAALAAAQKRVDDARRNLANLQQSNQATPADVAAAQAQVAQAQAQLARLRLGGDVKDGWMWPTIGVITSGFGLRDMAVGQFHNGLDIANVQGTPIAAARDGVVTEAGWCSGYGYCVKMSHPGGFTTEYGHLMAPPPVHAGQAVQAGSIIGAMGTTYDAEHGGYSTGVHLHFTIKHNGVAVDPLRYLP